MGIISNTIQLLVLLEKFTMVKKHLLKIKVGHPSPEVFLWIF